MEPHTGATPVSSAWQADILVDIRMRHWSGWCESNTRFSVPKADDFPLAYIPIIGTGGQIRTDTE